MKTVRLGDLTDEQMQQICNTYCNDDEDRYDCEHCPLHKGKNQCWMSCIDSLKAELKEAYNHKVTIDLK